MAMKRTKTPWMKAEDFGRSLPRGIGVNLLVPEIAPMEAFCRDVLGATIVYADEDFAAVDAARLGLHAACRPFLSRQSDDRRDRTASRCAAPASRSASMGSIRIWPRRAPARMATIVLAGAIDKPHGLRECHIVGPSGYVFVPSLAIGG